mgnify:CR=1 FL=1
MPITLIHIKFQVNKPIVFQSFSGFSTRGLLYELLRRVDAEYAEKLHFSKRLSPFSVSPIIKLEPNMRRIIYKSVSEASICITRFTFLEEKPAKIILNSIIDENLKITLSNVEVTPIEVSVSQYEYSAFLENAKPIEKFTVDFITPTYFRFSPLLASTMLPSRRLAGGLSQKRIAKARRFHPLPNPILLMRSIVRLWRTFSDKPFNYIDYLSWVSAMGISIAGFPKGIKTKRLYEHKTTRKFVVGFTGQVNYSIPEDLYMKKWAKITDALLKFAEYTNVGGNRTAGFGMIHYKPKEYYRES